MAGTSPAMTPEKWFNMIGSRFASCGFPRRGLAASPHRAGRIGEVLWHRGDLLLGHRVHVIDDLEESAGRRLDAPSRHQVRGVERRVVDDMIDNMETRRLHVDLRQLAAGTYLGLVVGGDAEFSKGPAHQCTERITA